MLDLAVALIAPGALIFLTLAAIFGIALGVASLLFRHPIDEAEELSLVEAYELDKSVEQITRENAQ